MVSRDREWGLLGRDKPKQEQREVLSPVWIELAWPGTGIKWMKSHFRQFWELPLTVYIYIIFSLYFSLHKIHPQMYKRCISIRSSSQTRPKICSQTRPGISLCSLFGLSLQGRGQFLVLLNQSEQEQEFLSALALDCLCQTGLTPWSVS